MYQSGYDRNNSGTVDPSTGYPPPGPPSYGAREVPGSYQQNPVPGSYYQPSGRYVRGIPGKPVDPMAPAMPGLPGISDEDLKVLRQAQVDSYIKRALPGSAIGMGLLYFASRKKFIRPNPFHYAGLVVFTSYAAQILGQSEVRKKIAESSSTSPYAQKIREQLGMVKPYEPSFGAPTAESDYSPESQFASPTVPSASPYYSPYNRYHRRQQANSTEFTEDTIESDVKDLTEFVADDVTSSDAESRRRQNFNPEERKSRSRLTYEELRMRNRAQYAPIGNPNTGYMRPQPPLTNNKPDHLNNNDSDSYNREGEFKY